MPVQKLISGVTQLNVWFYFYHLINDSVLLLGVSYTNLFFTSYTQPFETLEYFVISPVKLIKFSKVILLFLEIFFKM